MRDLMCLAFGAALLSSCTSTAQTRDHILSKSPEITAEMRNNILRILPDYDAINFLGLVRHLTAREGQVGKVIPKQFPYYRIAFRPGMAFYITIENKDALQKQALVWDLQVMKRTESQDATRYLRGLSIYKCDSKSTVPLYLVTYDEHGRQLSATVESSYQDVKATFAGIDSDALTHVCENAEKGEEVTDPVQDAVMLFGEKRTPI